MQGAGLPQAKINLKSQNTKTKDGAAFLLPDMGCSVIYAADEKVALGGNNEDYTNPFTMAWFIPPEEGNFGRIYFGYEGFIWGGGMNDQGLFFDAMAVGEPISVPQEGKPMYAGSLPDKVMMECDHVDCVIEIFSQYHSYDTWYHQFLFGDSYGNSVIVEPLTFLRNEKNYQVATNFYPSRGCPGTCDRYDTATNLFEAADTYSVELIRDILDAVHVESGSYTQYSQVYDLKTNTVYLYFFHDFKNPVIFQLDEELAKGKRAVVLADLFPENRAYLDLAQPKIDWIEGIRASYPKYEGDSGPYEAFTGKYALPPEMGYPYPYYDIALEGETLVLKIYSDKGWLDLIPFAENSFYHASSFSNFEITFIPDDDGQVDQFLYLEGGAEYIFNRFEGENPTREPVTPTATANPTATALHPTETQTAVPSHTPEPQKAPVTSTDTQPTQTVERPTTAAPESQSSSSPSFLWVLPIAALVLIAGWYLIRQRQ
jgi:hypothetical protein